MRVSSNAKMSDKQLAIFSANARELRKSAGFKTKDFADYVGVGATYYSVVENGHKCPSPELAERIAGAFGMTVKEMLIPLEEQTEQSRIDYGKKLRIAREKKGLTAVEVAGALGIPSAVYKEYEKGLCSITEREKNTLERLLLKEEVKHPVEVQKQTPKVEKPKADIVDIMLEHIKDLQVDVETQKKAFRFLHELKLAEEEKRLFG